MCVYQSCKSLVSACHFLRISVSVFVFVCILTSTLIVITVQIKVLKSMLPDDNMVYISGGVDFYNSKSEAVCRFGHFNRVMQN